MTREEFKQLQEVRDAIEEKRVRINSYDGYGKETFLAFDSYNLGLTQAAELLSVRLAEIENQEFEGFQPTQVSSDG